MLKNLFYMAGNVVAISILAGCGGGGSGGNGAAPVEQDVSLVDQNIGDVVTETDIMGEVFAGQNVADFETPLVPGIVAIAPTDDVTFAGTVSAIYSMDVDGNTSNRDVAIGDAMVSYSFSSGVVSGTADNFILSTTEDHCVEIPSCGLTPVSALEGMEGTLSITEGLTSGTGFNALLTGELSGDGGFAVPEETVMGGGFGKREGDDTLLIWGQADFTATTTTPAGSEEGTVRVLLGGAETN